MLDKNFVLFAGKGICEASQPWPDWWVWVVKVAMVAEIPNNNQL